MAEPSPKVEVASSRLPETKAARCRFYLSRNPVLLVPLCGSSEFEILEFIDSESQTNFWP
jgi:hypothetical protein